MSHADAPYLDALRNLPVVTPDVLLAGCHLVVVAPHPDDESLGMGGLLAAAQRSGAGVTVIFLTAGEGSHVDSPTWSPERLAAQRREEATDALAALGIPASSAHFIGLRDTQLPLLTDAQRATVQATLQALVPANALVCVTADTDPHGDHKAASALVRSIPWPASVTVMQYPVWTWHADPTNLPARAPHGYRVDIAEHVAAKRTAVAAHRTQHGEVIHDAREAFVLDPVFVERFMGPTETLTWPA